MRWTEDPGSTYEFTLIAWKDHSHVADTDFCSNVPDVLFDFRLYRWCRLHDFAYRGRMIPGYGRIDSRLEADLFFTAGLLTGVVRRTLGRLPGRPLWLSILLFPLVLLHFVIGLFVAVIYGLGVITLGWYVYQGPDD